MSYYGGNTGYTPAGYNYNTNQYQNNNQYNTHQNQYNNQYNTRQYQYNNQYNTQQYQTNTQNNYRYNTTNNSYDQRAYNYAYNYDQRAYNYDQRSYDQRSYSYDQRQSYDQRSYTTNNYDQRKSYDQRRYDQRQFFDNRSYDNSDRSYYSDSSIHKTGANNINYNPQIYAPSMKVDNTGRSVKGLFGGLFSGLLAFSGLALLLRFLNNNQPSSHTQIIETKTEVIPTPEPPKPEPPKPEPKKPDPCYVADLKDDGNGGKYLEIKGKKYTTDDGGTTFKDEQGKPVTITEDANGDCVPSGN
jgi:hypothetical protein